MTRKATNAEPQDVDQFPVTLDEFLTEKGKSEHEKKAAFGKLMQRENVSGHRLRAEWEEMYQRFGTMPVGAPWQK